MNLITFHSLIYLFISIFVYFIGVLYTIQEYFTYTQLASIMIGGLETCLALQEQETRILKSLCFRIFSQCTAPPSGLITS